LKVPTVNLKIERFTFLLFMLTINSIDIESKFPALQQAVRLKIEADENLARCINGR